MQDWSLQLQLLRWLPSDRRQGNASNVSCGRLALRWKEPYQPMDFVQLHILPTWESIYLLQLKDQCITLAILLYWLLLWLLYYDNYKILKIHLFLLLQLFQLLLKIYWALKISSLKRILKFLQEIKHTLLYYGQCCYVSLLAS